MMFTEHTEYKLQKSVIWVFRHCLSLSPTFMFSHSVHTPVSIHEQVSLHEQSLSWGALQMIYSRNMSDECLYPYPQSRPIAVCTCSEAVVVWCFSGELEGVVWLSHLPGLTLGCLGYWPPLVFLDYWNLMWLGNCSTPSHHLHDQPSSWPKSIKSPWNNDRKPAVKQMTLLAIGCITYCTRCKIGILTPIKVILFCVMSTRHTLILQPFLHMSNFQYNWCTL